jgi:hypothetical protein
MFDVRIYRAACGPLLLALVVAAFSLVGRSAPLRSTLAPDAFDGARAFGALRLLATRFPNHSPGGEGDDALAAYIAQQLRQPGGGAGGGFQVVVHHARAATIDGVRTPTTVIAQRPGSTGLSPIAIVAPREDPGRGTAALSGSATLLELGHVFSQSETRRTIVLVSAGAGADVAHLIEGSNHTLDAAIVLGDLAGTSTRKPFVLPFSSDAGVAPESLQRTLDTAIRQELGTDPGAPSFAVTLAHLIFPLRTGQQSSLNAVGVPSVLVQVSGERGPPLDEPVSEARLLNLGRAVLSATYALDEGPDIAAQAARVPLGRKTLHGWAVRLIVLALILPVLLVTGDAFARLRRRREPVLRWVAWVLAGGLPFFTCAVFAALLGRLEIVATSAVQPSSGTLSADGSAVGAVVSTGLVLGLALLAWPAIARRMGVPPRPSSDGAAVAVMLVILIVALIAWLLNPFACLLLMPALHLWLLAVEAGRGSGGRPRALALSVTVLSVLPLVLLLVVYAHELGLGAVGLAESAVVGLAGGQLGLLGALLWSVALGCLLAIFAYVVSSNGTPSTQAPPQWSGISTRGPVSYAGPGSLGGTESALRR